MKHETIQNQDKEWPTMGIYQAKWAVFNGRPAHWYNCEILIFSGKYCHHGEFGVLCIIFISFFIAKPPLTPLAMLAYLPFFTLHHATTTGCMLHWSWQWVGGSIIPLQAFLLVFNQFIICVEINNTNLSYGYRFWLFRPFHTLQTPLLDNGVEDQLSLFRHPYLGSGPLLRMACTSPVSFNCLFFTITELINRCLHSWHLHIYIILPILFSTSKQENLHKPFEWYSTIKANTTHQYTSSFTFSPYN